MITKVALTAWKRLFPYLSDASQHAIAKDVRKPLAEYNKGVALGNKNIAKRLGVDIVGDTGNSRVADIVTGKAGGAGFLMSGKRDIGRVAKAFNLPIIGAINKRQVSKAYGKRGAAELEKEFKDIQARNNARTDSVPTAFVRRSRGTAKDDFLRNTLLSHEMSEAKHYLSHYKVSPDGKIQTPLKGYDLARPAQDVSYSFLTKLLHPHGVSNGHVSLGVLRDELKGVMKSGYTDLHLRSGKTPKDFTGITAIRGYTGEGGQLINAGGGDHLLLTQNRFNPRYAGYDTRGLRNGVVKQINKKFLRNLDKVQRAHNVANPTNKPSKVGTAPLYIL